MLHENLILTDRMLKHCFLDHAESYVLTGATRKWTVLLESLYLQTQDLRVAILMGLSNPCLTLKIYRRD